uniref:RRM domain-containing protein n=1 Tax=Ditylenchus dipsaci TaxID=166011 RepID=A0A915CQW5_9BILA
MSSSSVSNDPLSKNASRTLYVGNLEKKVTDHCLKTRYGIYGHILEVELKSRDTAAPFAFIQFTNIKSVATAIGASHTANKSASGASGEAQKPVKVGWGKSICSNKLWIGALPKSCSKDYLLSKMRVITPDDVTEVMYDPNHNETLVLFKTNDAAQVAYSKIKNRVLIFPPEKLQSQSGNTHVQVDYCSEKLHDFFVDRQFGRFGGALPAVDGLDESADSNECQIRQADQLIVAQKKAASTTGGIPDTLLLAPPPDPPKNLATDVIARGNEHLGASNNQNERSNLTSSSQQSILNASIVPPDPAMTSR